MALILSLYAKSPQARQRSEDLWLSERMSHEIAQERAYGQCAGVADGIQARKYRWNCIVSMPF